MWSLWLNLWFNISVERYTNNLHISSTPKSRRGSSGCAPLITERHFAYTSEILEPERRQLMTVAKQPWSHPFGVLIKTRKKMWPDAWLGAQCKPEASFKVRVPSAPFATFISGFFFPPCNQEGTNSFGPSVASCTVKQWETSVFRFAPSPPHLKTRLWHLIPGTTTHLVTMEWLLLSRYR